MKTENLLFVALVLTTAACSNPKGTDPDATPLTKAQLRRLYELDAAVSDIRESSVYVAQRLEATAAASPAPNPTPITSASTYRELFSMYPVGAICAGGHKGESITDPVDNPDATKSTTTTSLQATVSGETCRLRFKQHGTSTAIRSDIGPILTDSKSEIEESIGWSMSDLEKRVFEFARPVESISLNYTSKSSGKVTLASGDKLTMVSNSARLNVTVVMEGVGEIKIVGSSDLLRDRREADSISTSGGDAKLEVGFPDFKAVIVLERDTDIDGNTVHVVKINGRRQGQRLKMAEMIGL